MRRSETRITGPANRPVSTTAIIHDRIRGGDIHCVSPTTTARVAAELLADQGIGAVPVLENGELVGIVSERDLLKRAVLKMLDLETTTVSQLMTTDVVTATPEDALDTCLHRVQVRGCRHLPIVKGRTLVGFLSVKDLLQMLVNQRSTEIRNLQTYMWGESIQNQELHVTWECGTCGHVHDAASAPDRCPGCDGIGLGFKMLNAA